MNSKVLFRAQQPILLEQSSGKKGNIKTSKWKTINYIFVVPIRLLASCLLFVNAFGLKNDFQKIKRAHNDHQPDITSKHFIAALIVAEDRKFYEHGGVDFFGILRAIWVRASKGIVQGASTIDQQLVRVVTGRYDLKYSRKIREILLASCLIKIMAKNEVARLYLSIAYYGTNMDGLHAACKRLGVDYNNASVDDASKVIARIKYPEPSKRSERRSIQIEQRTKYIQRQYHAWIKLQND